MQKIPENPSVEAASLRMLEIVRKMFWSWFSMMMSWKVIAELQGQLPLGKNLKQSVEYRYPLARIALYREVQLRSALGRVPTALVAQEVVRRKMMMTTSHGESKNFYGDDDGGGGANDENGVNVCDVSSWTSSSYACCQMYLMSFLHL